jgi:hypothetical protein
MAQIINIAVARQAKEAKRAPKPRRKAKAVGRLSPAASIKRDAVRQRAKAAL